MNDDTSSQRTYTQASLPLTVCESQRLLGLKYMPCELSFSIDYTYIIHVLRAKSSIILATKNPYKPRAYKGCSDIFQKSIDKKTAIRWVIRS